MIAACATAPAPTYGEIPGLEQFADPCPDEPPILTDTDVALLVQAMPTAEQREREFWAPNALALRKCVAHERAGREGALSAVARFNEAVRSSSQ